MKKFIEKNFLIIVLIISVLTFFKGCSDSRKITDLKSEVITLKNFINDSTYNKEHFNLVIKIEGLKAEKRMIQATDRKILDVQRQNEIDNEIKILEEKVEK